MAKSHGLSESLIGLTIVAVGTSLPELAALPWLHTKTNRYSHWQCSWFQYFQYIFVLGTSALIKPLPFNSGTAIDVMVACLASIILFALLFVGKNTPSRNGKGVFMILIYGAYIIFLINTK